MHLLFTIRVGSIDIVYMTVKSIGLTCKKSGSHFFRFLKFVFCIWWVYTVQIIFAIWHTIVKNLSSCLLPNVGYYIFFSEKWKATLDSRAPCDSRSTCRPAMRLERARATARRAVSLAAQPNSDLVCHWARAMDLLGRRTSCLLVGPQPARGAHIAQRPRGCCSWPPA
jgi:hypothetical protein